jgi:hypothetical protein
LSYESIRELAAHAHLAYLADTIVKEYEELAED